MLSLVNQILSRREVKKMRKGRKEVGKPVFSFAGATEKCFALAKEIQETFKFGEIQTDDRQALARYAALAKQVGLKVVEPTWFSRLFYGID